MRDSRYGNIEVSGWDRPDVSVRAELGEGVERVDVTPDHGRTVVKVVLPHAGHHGDAELHVKVPKESEVDISAVRHPPAGRPQSAPRLRRRPLALAKNTPHSQ